jgi:aminopeptidase
MKDKRIEKLAHILVNYSLHIIQDDLFAIYGNFLALPLIKEVYKQALKLGAHPYVHLGNEELVELYYKNASEKQLKYVSPLTRYETKSIDAKLSIISPENTKFLTHINPNKMAIVHRAHQPLHNIFLKRAARRELRWCVTQFPTQAAAQDAEMSLEDYEKFIYSAAHLEKRDPIQNWQTIYERQEKIRTILENKEILQIKAENTDLSLSVKQRKWINCAGKENFPDGEIFTAPIENSAKGTIQFSFPAVHGGRESDGIQLSFKNGKVVKAIASKGNTFLQSMLAMDKGARRIGEIAFGTNYGIKRYTKNTLFDEKIGGTIHIALGQGYPETGSKNNSGLHWDMVCDLRKEGRVYADEELLFKNGKFLC